MNMKIINNNILMICNSWWHINYMILLYLDLIFEVQCLFSTYSMFQVASAHHMGQCSYRWMDEDLEVKVTSCLTSCNQCFSDKIQAEM